MTDTPSTPNDQTAAEWLADVARTVEADLAATVSYEPAALGYGTVTPPADLTGCTCGDLTIEGHHRFDGTPCPH